MRIKATYERKVAIEIGARLGHRWYPKSEGVPFIIVIFLGLWGSAIILVLGAIFYWAVIDPIIEERKSRRNGRR
jgi:hypothetical protein